jgi:hypothetical protein
LIEATAHYPPKLPRAVVRLLVGALTIFGDGEGVPGDWHIFAVERFPFRQDRFDP